MGIRCDVELKKVGQKEFARLDRKIMRCAFDIHNEFGRFFDEKMYKKELADRCQEAGFNLHQEVRVQVFHESFTKPYFLDILINQGVIYELKTVKALNETHERQLINYLLIASLNHGKLILSQRGTHDYLD